MDKPTDKQIKEFWEWCGFYKQCRATCSCHPDQLHDFWYDHNGNFVLGYPLPIDLNNLFEYAVPKLPENYFIELQSIIFAETRERGYDAEVHTYKKEVWERYSRKRSLTGGITDKDPALALFWAIYSVISDREPVIGETKKRPDLVFPPEYYDSLETN